MDARYLETDFCECCGGLIYVECQCVIEALITAQFGKVESREFCHRHTCWLGNPTLEEEDDCFGINLETDPVEGQDC